MADWGNSASDIAESATQDKWGGTASDISDNVATAQQPDIARTPLDQYKHLTGLAIRSAGMAAGGILDTPAMVYNAGRFIGQQFNPEGEETWKAPYISPSIESGMTAIGVPEPKNVGEKIGVYAAPFVAAAAPSLARGGANIAKGIVARSPEEYAASVGATKQSGGAFYEAMKSSGAEINPEATKRIADAIKKGAESSGMMTSATHPKTLSIMAKLKQPSGAGMDLQQADLARRTLNRIANNAAANPEDASAARAAVDALDDAVHSLTSKDIKSGDPKALDWLKQGRAQWAQAAKMDDISYIMKKADGNPDAIKRLLTQYINKDKNLRGLNESEIKLLKEAANTTFGEGVWKLIGKTGVDLGSSTYVGRAGLPIIEALSGFAAGHAPAALGVIAAGTAARGIQRSLAKGKVETLFKALESRKLPASTISKMSPKEAKKYFESLQGPQQ